MVKKKKKISIGKALEFFGWLTGILIALAVGFSMASDSGTLTIRFLGKSIIKIFGQIIIATTVLSSGLAIARKLEIIKKKRKEKTPLQKVLGFFVWVTGILVSLSIASGMIDGVLAIRWIPSKITAIFGGIAYLTTLLGVILAILKKFE